ncbi:MAG: gamma-glutamylcyclotransferase [Planctomycetes bacterium]|nr:gamma-glutamylcyclotransferase [Planctomycetota bacterium]
MDQTTETLFVYGTLLPGLAPAGLLTLISRLRRLGAARVPGLLWDLGSYPCLIIDPAALAGPQAAWQPGRFQQVWSEALHFMSENGRAPAGGGAEAKREVRGELFELPRDPQVLRRLDHYEGFDPARRENLFERLRAKVLLERSRTAVPAWIYAFPRFPDSGRPIEGGDYRSYRLARRGL